MSWAEVKKINSNLDVPLDELIQEQNIIMPTVSDTSYVGTAEYNAPQSLNLTANNATDILTVNGKGVLKVLLLQNKSPVPIDIKISTDNAVIENVGFVKNYSGNTPYLTLMYCIHAVDYANVTAFSSSNDLYIASKMFHVAYISQANTDDGSKAIKMSPNYHTVKGYISNYSRGVRIANVPVGKGITFDKNLKVTVTAREQGSVDINYAIVSLG